MIDPATLMVCIVMTPGFQPAAVDQNCAPFTPNEPAVFGVYGDSNPRHWRHFKVRPRVHLSREEKCRDRYDARRVLLYQEPTRRIPKLCMTKAAQALRPDPAPAALKSNQGGLRRLVFARRIG